MEILVVGVGDAFSEKYWGTSFLVRTPDTVIAVDCPDSYFKALKSSGFGVRVDDLDGLFLTHLHGDHVNGLEMTLAWRKFVTQKRLPLFTTPEVAEVLWEGRLKASLGTMYNGQEFMPMVLEDYAEVTVVPWGQTTALPGGLTIETRQTLHHIPTAALLLTHQGHTFGHSCDTAFDSDLIGWLSDSDLFFHEANLGPAHTPIARLEELPESIRERMRIVHYSDHIEVLDHPGVKFAEEGQHFDLR